MQFDLIRDQHRTAAYLPSPLYVLYMQAAAYAEACGMSTFQLLLYWSCEQLRLQHNNVAVLNVFCGQCEHQHEISLPWVSILITLNVVSL
jgi:hypothetical protein